LYYHGGWVKAGDEWVTEYYAAAFSEDANENVRLDSGEDEFLLANACIPAGYAIPFIISGGNGDGLLTPANSAAGTLDSVVTTDEFGKGQFNLVYAKSAATWIKTRIRATTTVLGTETKAELSIQLPHSEEDEGHLPNSPYDDLFGLIGAVSADCPSNTVVP
jgi:hypothetical protein